MALTNEDRQFILTAIKGSEERILGQVPDIVDGIVKEEIQASESRLTTSLTNHVAGTVKDAVLDSDARVTKKILDHIDKKFAKVDKQFTKIDEQFASVHEDFEQLSKEVATAVNQDYDELKDCQRRIKKLELSAPAFAV